MDAVAALLSCDPNPGAAQACPQAAVVVLEARLLCFSTVSLQQLTAWYRAHCGVLWGD